jgi:hypothetical protein
VVKSIWCCVHTNNNKEELVQDTLAH